ncbi:GTP pyrophosphokinase family protein [Robertmurraya yapensis]|uniref:GTP pyrophosphokinase family protein n=2 Tax=Bacillaceae TaxID=186817 RepID=A0A3S0I6T0_9BACI|nr:GTP pyrophosphokinase family protein [Bacillus yapensis]RTR28799.1 GTP pyrophosphokinase family protein [Bacillus yapensis]TKS94657.1 GTP pyrophosphokinase family protein [Bacillus yapensis]
MSESMDIQELKNLKTELTRFMMAYKFALDEMNTKINILKEEFHYIHDYNPIEHVSSRVKSPDGILKKVMRKGHELSLSSIREQVKDIAGIRITCSFISDIYEISEMLKKQKDVKILNCKDYIQNPKPNGYQSLHLIVEIPIFMSDREEHIPVEIQIRTIAMDFWASLEHKIFYKYNKAVPGHLLTELKEAAITAGELDRKMERLHKEMTAIKELENEKTSKQLFLGIDEETFNLPTYLLESLTKKV